MLLLKLPIYLVGIQGIGKFLNPAYIFNMFLLLLLLLSSLLLK